MYVHFPLPLNGSMLSLFHSYTRTITQYTGQQTIGAGGAHFPTIAEMSKSSQPGSLSFTEWSDYNRLMDRRCYQGLISLLDASQKEFLDIVDTYVHYAVATHTHTLLHLG